MQSVRWLGFTLSNSLTKTIIHFFPSSGSVTAPYQAICKLTLFGNGFERKSVALEGARLSHPDGVRLDMAFPGLKPDSSGLNGLIVEISTTQPRVDLSASCCVIELSSRGQSARYMPRALDIDRTAVMPRLALKDPYATATVVAVNGTGAILKPAIHTSVVSSDGTISLGDAPVERVAPGVVREVPFDDTFYSSVAPQECSWGMVRPRTVWADAPAEDDVGYFIVYRDLVNKLPISAASL